MGTPRSLPCRAVDAPGMLASMKTMSHLALMRPHDRVSAFQLEGLESDHRVPVGETEQIYVALTKKQEPAEMVRYPDSGGWTRWRYIHRLYSTLEWWEQWLGEKPIS